MKYFGYGLLALLILGGISFAIWYFAIRKTDPTPGGKCTNTSDCVSGEVCKSGKCTPQASCSDSTTCAAGEACINDLCAPGCTIDDDCAGDMVCNAQKKCIPAPSPPPPPPSGDPTDPEEYPCEDVGDCEDGEVCDAGVCVAEEAKISHSDKVYFRIAVPLQKWYGTLFFPVKQECEKRWILFNTVVKEGSSNIIPQSKLETGDLTGGTQSLFEIHDSDFKPSTSIINYATPVTIFSTRGRLYLGDYSEKCKFYFRFNGAKTDVGRQTWYIFNASDAKKTGPVKFNDWIVLISNHNHAIENMRFDSSYRNDRIFPTNLTSNMEQHAFQIQASGKLTKNSSFSTEPVFSTTWRSQILDELSKAKARS